MKRLILLLFLVTAFSAAFGQQKILRSDAKFTQVDTYIQALSAFKIPHWATPTFNGGQADPGSLGFNTTSSKLMIYNGSAWVNVNEDTDLTDYYTKTEVDALLTAFATIDDVNNWLDGKVDKTTTVNGHPLSGDITLVAADVGALTQVIADGLYKDIGWIPDWDDLTNVPSEFEPAPHTHPISEVIDLLDSLGAKVNVTTTVNGQPLSGNVVLDADDVGALTEALADMRYKAIDWLPDWDDVENKPSTFAPSAHTHPIWQIVNLSDTLNNKQNVITGGATTITDDNLTNSRVLISSGTGKVAASDVTVNEVSHLSGVTGAIQGQLDDKIPLAQKGVNNGVAPINASGKIPNQYLDITGSEYLGEWNASTNNPSISDPVGVAGQYYRVTTGGTQDLGSGSITFTAGDDVMHNGSVWQRIPSTQLVASVNGQTGVVTIAKGDVGLGNVDNTSDLSKPISTATQSALDDKEDVVNKVTAIGATPNNTNYPSEKAVADYIATNSPVQLLSQPSIGQLAISGGNTVDLNTVNMSGNQTGIAGNKGWTGLHTFSNNVIFNSSGTASQALYFNSDGNIDWDIQKVGSNKSLTFNRYISSANQGSALTLSNSTGEITIPNLSGTGDRIVTASSTGVLSAGTPLSSVATKEWANAQGWLKSGDIEIEFGSVSGTVAEGNDERINNGQLAYDKVSSLDSISLVELNAGVVINNKLVSSKTLTDWLTAKALLLTGGTVTGAISWSGVPSNADHLVNKTYVDNAIAGAASKGEWIDVPATATYTLTWDSSMISKYGAGGTFQVWLEVGPGEYNIQEVPITVNFVSEAVVSYTFILSSVNAKILIK